MMKRVSMIVSIFLVCIIAILIYRTSVGHVDTETIGHPTYRDVNETLTIPGIVQPDKDFCIKSTISGVMDKVFVKVGDHVSVNEPIAMVRMVKDPEEYSNLMKQFNSSEARLNQAKAYFERMRNLNDKKLISQEDYEIAERDYLVVKSEYESLIECMAILNGTINDVPKAPNIMRATNNGVILELPIKEGGSVMARGTFNEGTTVARIADLNTLVFNANVMETDAVKLDSGMPVKYNLTTTDSISLTGTVISVAPMGVIEDGISRFEVKASIVIPKKYRRYVKAGSTINAKIITRSKHHVIALEEKYIQFSYDTAFVELKKENKYIRRILNIGISDGIYTEILSGLKYSDEVRLVVPTAGGSSEKP